MTTSNLRRFVIEESSFITEDNIKFVKNESLFRSSLNTSFISIINNFENQINNICEKNIIHRLTDFGDGHNKNMDPSIKYAILLIGKELIDRQGLNLVECTYYFVQARYNFMKSITFAKEGLYSESQIQNSTFTKILKNLEECFLLFDVKNNKNDNNSFNITLNCSSKNNLIRSLKQQVEKLIILYLNVLVIPLPTLTGLIV